MRRYISAAMRRLRKLNGATKKSMSNVMRPFREHTQERELLNTVRDKTQPATSQTPAVKRHKVAVIGAGGMGLDQCLGLQTLPQVEIVGVADQNPRSIERFRKQIQLPETRFYSGAKALLNEEKVDMVCVATNTTSHLAVARLAVEAGVQRLIVEKPIGNSVAQARLLAGLCAERKVKLAVNHGRRWSNDYAAVKRCIEHGYIGSLRHIYALPGPGGLAMIGVHFFDLLAYFANSPLAWIIGFLDTCNGPNRRGPQFKDPGGCTMVGFQNGIRGYVDVSDDLNHKDPIVILRGDAGRIEIHERRREWHLENASLGRRTFQFNDTMKEAPFFAKAAAQMLSETAPSCGAREGIDALEAVVAVHLSSSRDNIKISLPLEGKDAEPEFPFP